MRSSPVRLVLLSGLASAMAACGGDGPSDPSPQPPAAVATVTVSGTVGQPVPGDEIQLAASVRDAAGVELTGRAVVWTSSSDAVATVTQTGLVTAVAPGTATITATSEQRSGTKAVQVREGARIGPEGGTVNGLNGAVSLEVPAGALTEPVSITLEPAGNLPIDPSAVLNSGYVLGPAGTSLGGGAELTLQYAPDGAPSGVPESHFQIHRLDGGTAQGLGGSVDAGSNTATAQITKLGTFLVRRAPPDTPCTAPEYRQFDFWVGQWSVQVANAPPGALPAPSDISLEPGGCAVFENFANGNGLSLNVYSPADGKWHQTYVFANGQRLVLIGELQGSEMILTGPTPGPPGSFQRWTWTPLSGGRVRQLQEISSDGGNTLVTGFDGTYSPR
jgi:hypothetical protein